LNWKYEWIWAYVDMEIPWEFKIISAISWTPAEKSWLKWWDIVTFVNEKEITKENTVNEVVSWIKWPAWTKVKLTIKRWEETFVLEIERAKIVIKEVDYKTINNNIFYIQIRTFWNTVKSEFETALISMNENRNINTLILDLRNNPGWYLDQVTDMLGFFVELDKPTAVIKYKDYKTTSTSKWYELIDFSKYKIIILQNTWTASASEIMIWTIKDYYPNAILIWEKTYWKWSVQTIKPYSDWSALKYTIAKWFTWKSETWIDLIWIKPDIEEKIDEEKYKEWYDSQLQKAIEMSK
jgi:carboxyl-terminal processing protease